MSAALRTEELWDSAADAEAASFPGAGDDLPEAAQRYLNHAIAVGTPLASRARIRMHGEIKLGGWSPFEAEEVIHLERGMIWAATARLFGLPIRGSDRIVDGSGSMRWKLFCIPIVNDQSADVTRSTVGRVAAELVWLPSALAKLDVTWSAEPPSALRAAFELWGESVDLRLGIEDDGRPSTLALRRWGNPPESAKYDFFEFGGSVDEEATFQGFTVPTRLRVGWYAGSDRFEKEGEFIRVTVDEIEFR
jgi:hypothetical protein